MSADLILIPCKVKYPDLVSVRSIAEILRRLKITKKAWIVFNDIRKPHNKTYKEIKALFDQNYQDLKKAKSELTCLVGFTRVFTDPLKGQALSEIKSLIKELSII